MSFLRWQARRPTLAEARHAASSPRRTALAVALLFGVSSLFTYAAPTETFAWDTETVQLLVRGRRWSR